MRGPIGIIGRNRLFCTRVISCNLFHSDAVFDRADIDAKIATNAFLVDHFKMTNAINHRGYCLMRSIFASNMAASAFYAEILINHSFGDIVQIEILPICNLTHRTALKILKRGKALAIHPVGQAVDHLFHDLKAISHSSRADLNSATAKRDELSRISPCRNAANARNRQASRLRIARNFCDHIQGNWLNSRTAIATMTSASVNGWDRSEIVEINRDDRIDRVDQGDRIRTISESRTCRMTHIGDVWCKLCDHRHAGILLAPSNDHADIFRHLANSRTHAALAHTMRAAKIKLNPVRT